jgi:hypothetical protein
MKRLTGFVVLVFLFVGGTSALPVSANPNGSATIDLSFDAACNATVTFIWANYPGVKDTAGLDLLDEPTSTSLFAYSPGTVSGRSGQLTHTFALATSTTPHTFSADGGLRSNRGPARATNGSDVLVNVHSESQSQPCAIVF